MYLFIVRICLVEGLFANCLIFGLDVFFGGGVGKFLECLYLSVSRTHKQKHSEGFRRATGVAGRQCFAPVFPPNEQVASS